MRIFALPAPAVVLGHALPPPGGWSKIQPRGSEVKRGSGRGRLRVDDADSTASTIAVAPRKCETRSQRTLRRHAERRKGSRLCVNGRPQRYVVRSGNCQDGTLDMFATSGSSPVALMPCPARGARAPGPSESRVASLTRSTAQAYLVPDADIVLGNTVVPPIVRALLADLYTEPADVVRQLRVRSQTVAVEPLRADLYAVLRKPRNDVE